MKLGWITGAALLLSLPLAAAEAEEAVKTAAQKLAEKGNYSWTSITKMGGGSQFTPRPWNGKTDKSGTLITTTGRNDEEIQVAVKGDKRWMKTEGEWQNLEELAQGEQGQRGGFMARMMRDYKLPAEEAKFLAENSTGLKKDGEAYTAQLSKEGAQALVMRGFRRPGGDQGPDVKGTAKFWTKEGVLSKYEYNVQGKLQFGQDGREFDLDRTTTVEIKDAGATKVELPADLK